MSKKVLFVTYGGGHARMVIPVLRALQDRSDIECEVLALTTAGPIFKSEGLAYKGYKDFITSADKEALDWGRKLAATHHKAETGIEEGESIAYLGWSYWDLVQRQGETEAAKLWKEKGRHAFLQISVLERIISEVKPDIVVTTNSPKSEHAAIIVAKQKGIPNLSMVDLFGVMAFYTLESDYITVLMSTVVDTLLETGIERPREAFLVTGNPAFDWAFDYRGPIDYAWRHKHFQSLPDTAKTFLWLDQPAYWNMRDLNVHMRGDEEVIRDLDKLYEAMKISNACMLIRPHPSQQRSLFENWIKEKNDKRVFFAGGLPLYPLLKAIDVVISYTSTVGVEALLMQRPVIQLKKAYPGKSDMPLPDWGLAWLADINSDLPEILQSAFYDDAQWQGMQKRIGEVLPQEKAAPKVAAHIKRIVFG